MVEHDQGFQNKDSFLGSSGRSRFSNVQDRSQDPNGFCFLSFICIGRGGKKQSLGSCTCPYHCRQLVGHLLGCSILTGSLMGTTHISASSSQQEMGQLQAALQLCFKNYSSTSCKVAKDSLFQTLNSRTLGLLNTESLSPLDAGSIHFPLGCSSLLPLPKCKGA